MENVILDDSPLAEFLEGTRHAAHSCLINCWWLTSTSGEGKGASRPASPSLSTSPTSPSFAPRGPSTLQSRIRDKLPQPLRIHERHGSISRIHTACSVRSPYSPDATHALTHVHRKQSIRDSDVPTTNASSNTSATLLLPLSF
jgi:hypothetical protein